MTYLIAHWIQLGLKQPHPKATVSDKEMWSNNSPENKTWEVELTPEEIVELHNDHDVMIKHTKSGSMIFLDEKGKGFRQR